MKKLLIYIIAAILLIAGCSLDDTTNTEADPNIPDHFNALVINEFMSHNQNIWQGPDNDYPDWIELYNGSNESIDIGGMYFTDDMDNLMLSPIVNDQPAITTIAPHQYLIFAASGNAAQGPLNLDFSIKDNEDFALVYKDGVTIIDAINTGNLPDDKSWGRIPDGSENWELINMPTPGMPNTITPPVNRLVINEFLASNEQGLCDENGDYDDWIEIYNAGTTIIDLGGMYITDDLNDLTVSMIPTEDPDITTLSPGEFLLLWADKEPEQGILHLDNVKLSAGGEQIGLIDIDGITILDSLTYDSQTTDISYGRLPDGTDNWQFFDSPTPGEPNQ